MAKQPLHIPAFLNYACERCGWCCRQEGIPISEAEQRRIAATPWAEVEPELADKELWKPLPHGRSSSDAPLQLGYTPGLGCVFLTEKGLCRIHSHVSESAKPLRCRVFPFSFADTPSGVYVGARFSCPAVAFGRGRPLVHEEGLLRRQARSVRRTIGLPRFDEEVTVRAGETIPWEDYLELEAALTRVLFRDELPLKRRLLAFHEFTGLLGEAQFEKVRGERFKEFVELLEEGLLLEAQGKEFPARPGRLHRMLFRLFNLQFQQRGEILAGGRRVWRGIRGRLRMTKRAAQLLAGRGTIPLDDFPGSFSIRELAGVRLHDFALENENALSRFMAAKLFGKQIFGRMFYGYSLLDGLRFLMLTAGSALWYARAHALARGAEETRYEDIVEGIRYVDYCYAWSAVPGQAGRRMLLRLLSGGAMPARVMTSQF